MNVAEIENNVIDPLSKNVPNLTAALSRRDVAAQGWNVLREDLPLPLAVLKQSKLLHNAQWMQNFLASSGVVIAPHGKTTMSPQLFKLQMDCGAWGMTVATVQQLRVCRRFGINRVLMANQLLGKQAIRYVLNELQRDPKFQFFAIVDSIENIAALVKEARELNLNRPLNLLIELGVKGKRTGCRSVASALEVAHALSRAYPLLALAGVECFEGLLVTDDPEQDAAKVSTLLTHTMELARRCEEEQLFNTDKIIISAGGSAYFDIVSRQLTKEHLKSPHEIVLRSGCYLTHDAAFYDRLFTLLANRLGQQPAVGRLEPALEVWAYVQSCPEADLAILNLGKRDCSYDIDLPVPTLLFNAATHQQPQRLDNAYQIFKLDDQHAYMRVPSSAKIQVGDLIACGISHPCTTFDKWRELFVVDDEYNVVNMIKTYF